MRECGGDGKPCPYYDPAEFLGAPKPLNGCMCQDGSCEACNRVAEAWEAMREALRDLSRHAGDTCHSRCEYLVDAKRSLALADEVSRVTSACDAQDHSTEAEYQACRICHPDEAAKGKP